MNQLLQDIENMFKDKVLGHPEVNTNFNAYVRGCGRNFKSIFCDQRTFGKRSL
jgi:hypothetical protein